MRPFSLWYASYIAIFYFRHSLDWLGEIPVRLITQAFSHVCLFPLTFFILAVLRGRILSYSGHPPASSIAMSQQTVQPRPTIISGRVQVNS